MIEDSHSGGEPVLHERALRTVKLVGFSQRDRELLRLFLRRPPGAGVSLTLVEGDADILIANAVASDVRDSLLKWSNGCAVIGIVERFEREAPYYQVTQDGQLLFSLAQAINRIRSGWVPPYRPDVASALEVAGKKADSVHNAVGPAESVSASETGGSPPASSTENVPLATPEPPGSATRPPAVSEAAALMASAGLPWQRAISILVIDDSHFSREAIAAALVKIGFLVDTVDGGVAGIRRASEKLFDVALVDFEMPGMQGPEVLRKLRALGPKAPTLLIMLTSRTGAVDKLRAKFAGCDAYLTKPTRMQEFLNILRDFAVAGKLSRP
jgi:CheY-like chemotaxis protein